MITRIEIDGFKTFKEFSLDLAPFQVIIGANASGKSNLFEAIRLLSLLADMDVHSAFQKLRGEPDELFTIQPDGQPGNRIRFAVEMLVDKTVRDAWGENATLSNPRLRYELEIVRREDKNGMPWLEITSEHLHSIEKAQAIYIRTRKDEYGDPVRDLLGDISGVGSKRRKITVHVPSMTLLSRVSSCEKPHALAARQVLHRITAMQLSVEKLRQPSSMFDSWHIAPDGSNLANALAYLENEDPTILAAISRDMANLVPEVAKVEVERDEVFKRHIVYVTTRDGRRLSSRVLSDGILRLLALVTLKYDATDERQVLLLEEPENSVHPAQFKRLVRLLRDMTTDLNDPEQTQYPLRQLLVNTHSPEIVSQLDVEKELLFAHTVTRVGKGQPPMTLTRIAKVRSDDDSEEEKREGAFTLAHVLQYLSGAAEQTRAKVKEVRGLLLGKARK